MRVKTVEHVVELTDGSKAALVAHLHECATASDLLRSVALHDHAEAVVAILLSIDTLKDSLRNQIQVTLTAYDVKHL